ncbi:MAG: cation:proton antiporter [Cyanobacteriota bacterium]
MALNRLDLTWSLAFLAGSCAQLLARFFRLPAVVVLLAVGLLIGRAGLDLVRPEVLGDGLAPLIGLLVSLVLFDGGLNLRLAGREQQRSALQLVLVRSALGLVAAALFAHGLAGLSWTLAWVFGAIVLATGPTVVTPMVRQMRLRAGLGQLLEAEGLMLEPFSAVLALLLLQLGLGDLSGWQDLASRLLLRLAGGSALGAGAGLVLAALLQRLLPDPSVSSAATVGEVGVDGALEQGQSLALQLSLGVLFVLFSGAEALLPESGLPAAVTAGVVVGWRLGARAVALDALISQLAMLAITVLFPLLAADVAWSDLSPLGLGGLGCVLAVMGFRWVVIQVAGLGVDSLGWREKLILSWIAPRGIVTAAIASLFALKLDGAGVPGGDELKGLVFLTILMTVGLQGFTAPLLASRLDLLEPELDHGVAISPLPGEPAPEAAS